MLMAGCLINYLRQESLGEKLTFCDGGVSSVVGVLTLDVVILYS